MELYIITIAWLFGILSGLYFKIGIVLFVLLFIILFLFRNKAYFQKMVITKYSIIFLLCYLISYTQIINLEKSYHETYKIGEEEVQIVGTIISNPNKQDYKTTYLLKVESMNHNSSYQNTNLLLHIKNEKNANEYSYGNQITFVGSLKEVAGQRNEGGFDYKNYLKTQKIHAIIETKKSKVKLIKEKNVAWLFQIVNTMACKIEEKAYQLLEKQEASLLTGILIGKKENLDESVQEAFRKSNLSHMLAVSGAHTSYVILAITFLFAISKIGKRNSKLATMFILFLFMLLTGNTPSVTRACYMAIYFIIAYLFHKKVSALSAIFISALFLMIQNPYCILDVGFELSYAGTIGIIVCYPIMKSFFYQKKKKEYPLTISPWQKILQAIKELLLVTISANLILVPIILYHFNTLSLTFLLSNLLASPIMAIVVILGFLTIFFSFLCMPIGKLLSILLGFFLNLLLQIATFTSKLPFSQILVATPKLPWIISYYFFIAVFYFSKKKKWHKKINKKKVIIVFFILFLFYFTYLQIPKEMQIHFIDVGQGDSTLIITPRHQTILVDGGGSENFDVGKNTLIPYLLDKGITKLNYVFISHFDVDHVKSILTLLETMKVKQVVITKQGETSENYEMFQKIVKEKQSKVLIVKKKEEIEIEPKVKFQILWPKEKQIKENILNNNSMVTKLTYQNFSMLLTGDIEQIAEQEIVQEYQNTNLLKSTILKVAHHGSKTSSTQEFLEQVKPKIAFIGVGKNNTFGHPNDSVIKRLENLRCKNI